MAADFLNGNPNRKQKISFYILSVKHKALNVRHHRRAGFADFAKVILTPTYA